jgi:hypothetical protein
MPDKICEAPDHGHDKHPAVKAVVSPRGAYWFWACADYIEWLKNEIAMGRSQLTIKKDWWGEE